MVTLVNLFDQATALHWSGDLAGAEKIYRQILQTDPNHADAFHMVGLLASQTGNHQAAAEFIRRAVTLNPSQANYYRNLGIVYKSLEQWDDAIASYRRVLELQPDDTDAALHLGILLQDQGRPDEAGACFETILQHDPTSAIACNNLGMVRKSQGLIAEALAFFEKAIELKPDYVKAHDNLVYTLHFDPDQTPTSILAACRRWGRQHADPLATTQAPRRNEKSPGRPLRIGYVSPNFCEQAESFFTVPLFANHDHAAFEIFFYADVAFPDDITTRIRACADGWRNIVGLSDAEVARLVREDQIDILVDLTMHMGGSRLLVFAQKPRPFKFVGSLTRAPRACPPWIIGSPIPMSIRPACSTLFTRKNRCTCPTPSAATIPSARSRWSRRCRP